MSELRIFISAEWQDAASLCQWVLLDERGGVLGSGTGNIASMPHADECSAIVAADQVLCVPMQLPKIKRRQLETALPFALEEYLLGVEADHHIVPGSKLPNGNTLLYSLNKNWFGRFVSACTTAHLRLGRVVPEYCLLPVQPGEWSLVWNGAEGFLATGWQAGGALGRGSMQHPPATLCLNLNGVREKPSAIRLYFTAQEECAWPQWKGLPVDMVGGELSWDWRRVRIAADVPNLLWGKFSPPARIQEWWPKVRPAMLVLLLLLAVELVGNNVQWWLLASEKHRLERTMDSLFQETFGAEVAVVDAPLQMRRSLARLRHTAGLVDDADFTPLLDRFSAELAAFPDSKMNTLHYADGQMDVEVRLSGRSVLDAIQRRLEYQGMHMQVVDVRENAGGVDVHMKFAPESVG